ncbi:MAG: hypothetical protein HYU74_13195 [Dechloromonas sp.]|nr:hypothetical protein [Dechloromonas sp.]
MITTHYSGVSFSAETPIDLDPIAASGAVNAGLSAGLDFFNGQYTTLEGYLVDRGNESSKTAQMATIASQAGLWNLARLLHEVKTKRIANFDADLPTPDHFVYQSLAHPEITWSTYAPTLCASVRALRRALPGIQAGPDEPPPKDTQVPQKIEIVGMPEQQTVITRMPDPPRAVMARQTVEHDRNDEIVATVTTYEYDRDPSAD